MKKIVCPSTDRIIDDGTVVPAGTPHYETPETADQLIGSGLAKEVPEEQPAAQGETVARDETLSGPVFDDSVDGATDE